MTASARISPADHLARPWRVHGLAPDFELLDVWRFGLRGKADQFREFTRMMADMERSVGRTNWLTRALFGIRMTLGRWFGWDRERPPLPIPGCREHSVAARLPGGTDVVSPRSEAKFHPIYEDDREALTEISNGTVHALMHLGWVELDTESEGQPTSAGQVAEFAPQMAVYVKHRGLLGRLYMALIGPFRHYVVYPSLLRAVERSWSAEANVGHHSHRAVGQAILRDG